MQIDAIDSFTAAATAPKPAVAPRAPAPAPASEVQAVNMEAIKKAVRAANEIVAGSANAIEFSIDSESGGTIIRVLDKTTREVIRQMPSEDMLRIRHAIDTLRGLMLDHSA